MSDTKQLLLFGRPRFIENGQAYELTYRKGRALFAYLGLSGKGYSRDSLASLLWPEYSQTRARANLRRTLYAINQADLGHWLAADPDNIALDDNPPLRVDASQYQALINRWQNHQHHDPIRCPECLDTLRQAIDIYTSDFLADFYIQDSNAFEAWATHQRERLRQSYFSALQVLGKQYLATGDLNAAQQIAFKQIESDNLNENGHRQLMISLALSGQRNKAIQVYDELRNLLGQELAIEPDEITEALAGQIRSGELIESETNKHFSLQTVAKRAPIRPAPSRPISDRSPYRGLNHFREQDAKFFFGREEFTEELLEAVARQSIVAVIGPSGSGKSSVIYAGLVAELRSNTDDTIASFRPADTPFHALSTALLPLWQPQIDNGESSAAMAQLSADLKSGEISLIDIVGETLQQAGNKHLLLLIDQFEELYTRCPDRKRRHRFLDVLLEAVFHQQYRDQPAFTLVFTLRSDFLGQALTYRPLADALQGADAKIGPMTRTEIESAIVRPAAVQGVRLEPGLVSRICDDVGQTPGNLPFLEFALEMLWQEQEAGQLTHAGYDRVGRVDGALTRYAEHIFRTLTPEEQVTARRIFIQLVQPGQDTADTRRVATRNEFGEAEWTIAQDLAAARLLILGSDRNVIETVEVVHEALISGWGRLRDWMIANREFRLWQERLRGTLEQWLVSNRDDDALLRGVSLSIAETWLRERSDDISQVEMDFILASQAARDRRQQALAAEQKARDRFRRRLSYAGIAALIILSLISVFAIFQWRQAESQRQVALAAEEDALSQLAGRLAASAQNLPANQLDVSLLLSAEANNLVDNATTRNALDTSLGNNPVLLQYGQLPFNPFAVTVKNGPPQPGNQLYLHFDGSPEITSWAPDWQSGRLSGQAAIPFPTEVQQAGLVPHHLASSSDSSFLAMAFCSTPFGEPCLDTQITLWQTARERFQPIDFPQQEYELTALTISPDGSWLAQGNVDGTILIWDTSLGRSIGQALSGHLDAVRLLAISPDGRWLASWSQDGLLNLWDIRRLSTEPVAQFGGHSSSRSLLFNPDSSLLLSAGQSDEDLLVWELDRLVDGRGTPSWRLAGPQGGSFVADFSPDGQYILAGGFNGQIFRWSVADLIRTQESATIFEGHKDFISAFFFDNSGTMMSLAPDATILWDLSGASLPKRLLQGHQQHVASLAFSPNDAKLYSVGCDRVGSGGPCSEAEFMAWEVTSANLITPSIAGPVMQTWDAKFTSDGESSILASMDETRIIHNPVLGIMPDNDLRTLPIQLGHAFALSPDGRWLATGNCQEADLDIPLCLKSSLSLWELPDYRLLFQAPAAHDSLIEDINFAPGGRSLATVGTDGRLYLWEWTEGELKATQINNNDEVVDTNLAFSPDGRLLAGAGCVADAATGLCEAGATWIWDLASSSRLVGPLMNRSNLLTYRVVFSPDGRHLVTGEESGAVTFWAADTGERQLVNQAHTGPVISMRFSHQGRYLATGGLDQAISLFNVDTLLAQLDQSSNEKVTQACRRAGRNLTNEEWATFFGDVPYRATCPETQE